MTPRSPRTPGKVASAFLTEPNFGGGMFSQLLRSAAIEHYPCQIEDAEWQRQNKEQRIVDILEPILNQHKLVVSPEVIIADYESVLGREYDADRAHYYRLMYQLSHMVREKGALAQDDRLDALAGAVSYFLPYISTNSEKAHLQMKEDAIDAELEKFMNGVLFGRDSSNPPRPYASKVLSNMHSKGRV